MYVNLSLVVKDPIAEVVQVPALQLGANTGERFVVELPSDALQSVTVGKPVHGRLPRAVMNAATLAGGKGMTLNYGTLLTHKSDHQVTGPRN